MGPDLGLIATLLNATLAPGSCFLSYPLYSLRSVSPTPNSGPPLELHPTSFGMLSACCRGLAKQNNRLHVGAMLPHD